MFRVVLPVRERHERKESALAEEEQLAAGGATKLDWIMSSGGTVDCFRSTVKRCILHLPHGGGAGTGNVFLKANVSEPFQDDELMGVTDELNGLLQGVAERNSDRSEKLAILLSSRGLFLAWVTCDEAIGPDDAEKLGERFGY